MHPTLHPCGIGVYARGKPIRPHILQAARCRWVALMVESVDGRVVPLSELRAQARRARQGGARDIWLWALHGAGVVDDARGAAHRLTRHLAAVDGAGVILDVEAAHKGKPLACRELVRATLDGLTETTGLGITSYPLAAMHPTMPWEEMRAGWGSPQCYETAGSEARSRRSVTEWRAWHGQHGIDYPRVVVPSLACYETTSPGTGAAQLRGDLERVCLGEGGSCDVPGVCLWSEPQLSLTEAIEAGEWAQRWGW